MEISKSALEGEELMFWQIIFSLGHPQHNVRKIVEDVTIK